MRREQGASRGTRSCASPSSRSTTSRCSTWTPTPSPTCATSSPRRATRDATPLSRAGGCLTPDQPATCRPTRAPPRAWSSRELEYRAAGEARRRQDEEETPARSQHKEEEIGDAGAKPGLAAGPALKRHCCFSSSISFITHTKPGLVAGPAAVSLPRRRWRQSSPDSPASRALSGLGPQSDVGPVMTAPQGRRPSSRAVCAMRRRRAEAQGRCQVNDSDVD